MTPTDHVCEGWVLVPREPGTCELDDSGWLLAFMCGLHFGPGAPQGWSDFSDDQRERIKAAYRAMLAAVSPAAETGGAKHTLLMEAIRDELLIQHAGAFHEDTDSVLVIPGGATPHTAYVKIDTSALAEAVLSAAPTPPAPSLPAGAADPVASNTFEIGKPAPYFCPACQAVPQRGYCKLAGCPTNPDASPTTAGSAEGVRSRDADLLRRGDVIAMLHRLAENHADLAIFGESADARQREAMEASFTHARCAVALMRGSAEGAKLDREQVAPEGWETPELEYLAREAQEGYENPIAQVAFRAGFLVCREYMARFVEQGGDAVTAGLIRANWIPAFGDDPGPPRKYDFAEVAEAEDMERGPWRSKNPGPSIDAAVYALTAMYALGMAPPASPAPTQTGEGQ